MTLFVWGRTNCSFIFILCNLAFCVTLNQSLPRQKINSICCYPFQFFWWSFPPLMKISNMGTHIKRLFILPVHRNHNQRFKAKYTNLSMAELLKAVWNLDIHICPKCGCCSMQHIGRTYGTSWSRTFFTEYFFQRPPQEGLRSIPFYRIWLCNHLKNVFRMLDS